MRYTTKLTNTKRASITVPLFFFDNADKKQEAGVRRMNSFYEELRGAAIGYTESESFPEGARYFVKTTVDEGEDFVNVRVVMRLRLKGKTKNSRVLIHKWKDGVIVYDKKE